VSRGLLVVAASGLAREALNAARGHEVIGIVDDDATKWGDLVGGVKVLGGLDVVADHPDASVLLCAGRGSARAALADRLQLDELRYATVVHPSVEVPDGCAVGIGSIVLAGCVLTADVHIGRHVVAMPHVTLTHDDVVGDYATLCAGVALGGAVEVGPRAYLGMSSSVRERCRIGADATVGMGATVVSDVPAGETWVGVPAKGRV
jgi:sugar O-acyltransferase (sialic acid O-acetyltransferase NeuD family)